MDLNFNYSNILDILLHELSNADIKEIPDRKRFSETMISKLEQEWNEKGFEIIKNIQNLTKNKFHNNLTVYILPSWPNKTIKFTAISNPIIITVDRPVKEIFNLLIHELIHSSLKKYDFSKQYELFAKESELTKKHILVHAILKEVLLQVYNEERYLLDKKMCSGWENFKRAWDIVDEKGSKEVIDIFLR